MAGRDKLPPVRRGDPVSATEWNTMRDLATRHNVGPGQYADSQGVYQRPMPVEQPISIGAYLKLSGEPESIIIDSNEIFFFPALKQIHSLPGVFISDPDDSITYRLVFEGVWGEYPDPSLFPIDIVVRAQYWGVRDGSHYYVKTQDGPWAIDLQRPPLNVCYDQP